MQERFDKLIYGIRKISVSLSFLNWFKNEIIFLSYLWINVGNDKKSFHINLLNLSWIINCLFLRNMESLRADPISELMLGRYLFYLEFS